MLYMFYHKKAWKDKWYNYGYEFTTFYMNIRGINITRGASGALGYLGQLVVYTRRMCICQRASLIKWVMKTVWLEMCSVLYINTILRTH